MAIIHEKKYEAIDSFDTEHWEVIVGGPGERTYRVKDGAPPQTIRITRPSGGTQTHVDMPPGSTVEVDRDHGTATVTV